MKNDDLKLAYELYYQPLFLYALSLVKNKQDAEDLVANTFVKALLSFEKGNLKPWLFKVLKNEYYQLYQKKKRFVDRVDLNQITDSTSLTKNLFIQEAKQWLYTQIYQLPGREQEIILLSIQAELNDQQIADIMHLSVENVRVIRHRIKTKLKELCQKEGIL